MMSIAWRNSMGFFKIENYKNEKEIRLEGVTCSEKIRKTSELEENLGGPVREGKITFYFPTQWMYPNARYNNAFFKNWLKLASDYFCPVTYIGKRESKDLKFEFANVKGYTTDSPPANNFGVTTEDSWETFEIGITKGDFESQRRQYCTYCWVRYLFSEHYWNIISSYQRIQTHLNAQILNIDPFIAMQMAHYYYTGYNGYCETYTLIKSTNIDQKVWKLISLKDYNEKIIDVNTGINGVFSQKGASEISVLEFQKLLDGSQTKKVYEAIK